MISREELEAIRLKLDWEALAGEYLPRLERAGRQLKSLCPFHSEKTPSFYINPERQTFHCFGCGEGGDVFAFVMKMESLTFSEAARELAERVGVRIGSNAADSAPQEKERRRAREALEAAARLFHETLLKSSQAEPARTYLKSRGVTEAVAAEFELGFAPEGGSLLKPLSLRGFSPEILEKAGLLHRGHGGLREYFSGRLIFPIRDAKGIVAGFGGRLLGHGEPKYLNSPDTPVFSKRKLLYGLHKAVPTLRAERRAILVEGYMDVISAHSCGFATALAPLGTALSQDHAALLKRYASSVVVAFDSDSAGIAATIRAADALIESGFPVSVAQVPEGKDPDGFLKSRGSAAFAKVLAGAADAVKFKIETILKESPGPLSADFKAAAARKILETIRLSPDEIVKSEWMRMVSQRLGVPEEALRRQALKGGRPPLRQQNAAPRPSGAAPWAADRALLILIFQEPALAARLEAGDFLSQDGRRLWEGIRGIAPGSRVDLLAAFEGPLHSWASEIAALAGMTPAPTKPADEISKILKRRRARAVLNRLEPLMLGRTGPASGRGARPSVPGRASRAQGSFARRPNLSRRST